MNFTPYYLNQGRLAANVGQLVMAYLMQTPTSTHHFPAPIQAIGLESRACPKTENLRGPWKTPILLVF